MGAFNRKRSRLLTAALDYIGRDMETSTIRIEVLEALQLVYNFKQAAVIKVETTAHRTPKQLRTGIERAMYAIPQDLNIPAGSAALAAACASRAMLGQFACDLPT